MSLAPAARAAAAWILLFGLLGVLGDDDHHHHHEYHAFLTVEDFLRPLNDDAGAALTDEDFRRAEELPLWPEDVERNGVDDEDQQESEEATHRRKLSRQSFYKGDLRGKATWRMKSSRTGARRNGVIATTKKWPGGRIPYVLAAQYNERERAVLAKAFQEYHRRTCIRFVPRTALDHDYLFIGKIDGCFSDVGRAGGRQELSLDDGCLQFDTAIHELMHSVGFYHEHERWDRDQHITILWHNIDKDAYDQFGKVDLSESSYYGQAYDYHSIMHYDSLAFSKNGFETMVARRPEMTAVIGSAIDFSPTDLIKINTMYQCGSNGQLPSGAVKPVVSTPQSQAWPAVPVHSPPPPPPQPSPILLPMVGSQQTSSQSSSSTSTASASSSSSSGLSTTRIPSSPPESDECADRTNLCWRWLDRCRSFFFEKIMREFCMLSCGFCQPRGAASPSPQGLLSVARADPATATVGSTLLATPIYRQLG